MRLFRRSRKRVVRRRSSPAASAHYRAYKEFAREVISARIVFWNAQYRFSFGRVSIKNQRRCWGSCSAKGNLNFSYKIVFLPEALMDYVIVHELCHLAELNHSSRFWAKVSEAVPDYAARRAHLRRITQVPSQGFPSSTVSKHHNEAGVFERQDLSDTLKITVT